MKTPSLRKEDVKRNWYLGNAQGKTLGRLATAEDMQIAITTALEQAMV